MIPISTGECTSDEAKSSVPADMMKCATEGNKYLTFDTMVDGVQVEWSRSRTMLEAQFST